MLNSRIPGCLRNSSDRRANREASRQGRAACKNMIAVCEGHGMWLAQGRCLIWTKDNLVPMWILGRLSYQLTKHQHTPAFLISRSRSRCTKRIEFRGSLDGNEIIQSHVVDRDFNRWFRNYSFFRVSQNS